MSDNQSSLTAEFSGDIGVARDFITPPVGIYSRNWGAAAHDIAEGVHRPLTVTALVLSNGGSAPLVMVAADLGWWKSRDDEWFVRGALLETLGLEPERVVISLSHTHAGPSLYRDDGGKPGGQLIAPFLVQLRDRIINVVRAALDSRRPCRLSWRYGRCDLARNRDLPELGTDRYVVGLNPAASADDTLLVGRVEEVGSGRLRAVLVNYACHPTTLAWQNRLLSPDFPGALRELVERVTGASCLFLQGASGELAPAEQYVGDAAVADRHGRRLGHAVLGILEGWTDASLVFDGVVESGAALAVHRVAPPARSDEMRALSQRASLTLKSMPTVAEIEVALQAASDRTSEERLWRQRVVRRIVGDGASAAMPLWAWKVGEALVVASPNEPYSLFQRELRQRFVGRPVVVLSLTNGAAAGYLPPRELYTRDQYQVWQSPFARGALEETIRSAEALLEQVLVGQKTGVGDAPPAGLRSDQSALPNENAGAETHHAHD